MNAFESLGITEWPAPDSLNKLLNDHLVCERAQQLMIASFAERVIEQMHPLERAALLKRISPPPIPAGMVSWHVEKGTYSGTLSIVGRCGRCNQDTAFAGKPDAAQTAKWAHCTLGPSAIPAAVVEEYRAQYFALVAGNV
jgi:hypothetical protein